MVLKVENASRVALRLGALACCSLARCYPILLTFFLYSSNEILNVIVSVPMSDLFSDCDMLVEEFEHQPDPATVDESTTSNVRTSSSSGALPLSDTSHSNEVVSVRNAHPPFLEQDLIHPRASDVALDPMSLSSHPAEHLNMNIAGPRDRFVP